MAYGDPDEAFRIGQTPLSGGNEDVEVNITNRRNPIKDLMIQILAQKIKHSLMTKFYLHCMPEIHPHACCFHGLNHRYF